MQKESTYYIYMIPKISVIEMNNSIKLPMQVPQFLHSKDCSVNLMTLDKAPSHTTEVENQKERK